MWTDARRGRFDRRVADLLRNDEQFAAARPDVAVTEAIHRPATPLSGIVDVVMAAYADRPALGYRALRRRTDSVTGRSVLERLPRFETVTYHKLWDRASAVATGLAGEPVQPGDRVCTLGFPSVDYATVDLALLKLGAVSVPLQTVASVSDLRAVIAETRPSVFAASVDHLATMIDVVSAEGGPDRVVVFDYHPDIDDHRDALDAARARLAGTGSRTRVATLDEVIQWANHRLPVGWAMFDDPDPLRLLIYTSGSTGTPKGAMHTEHVVANQWLETTMSDNFNVGPALPTIILHSVPMSHNGGRYALYGALGAGGTAYFGSSEDQSTLLEDLALVRPTQLGLVPRVWDVLRQEVRREVDRRVQAGGDAAAAEAEVMAEQRRSVLGGRYVAATTGSAPMSAQTRNWVEAFLDMPLMVGYGSTECHGWIVDGRVRRPPVTDYKLVDVPELGYLSSDRPHPRGEVVVKSELLFAGYYHRPDVTAEVFDADGYYRTGDVFEETGPDELQYLGRRNDVLKLAQGEFVAVSRLEAEFRNSPLVEQIYVYGNSAYAYLLAVVVPTEAALSDSQGDELTSLIGDSLREVARNAGLQPFELPRAFIVETVPFTVENGLLTAIGKPARRKLEERYGQRLEQLYADLADGEQTALRDMRRAAGGRSVLETVLAAASALTGSTDVVVRPDSNFTDIGGDSLSAVTFANVLRETIDVDVPVGFIIGPVNDLRAIADYIEEHRGATAGQVTFEAVHGRGATVAHAHDLTLDKFIDEATLRNARDLPLANGEAHTVLLTGATGFTGRYVALEWLERLSRVDGTLICLVRGEDDAAARRRLDAVFDGGDARLVDRYRELAEGHLLVLAGDKAEVNLGLDEHTWRRLADTVDLIVDPAALVNHALQYAELFGPNTAGTAELIRLAVTTRRKPYAYVSTRGVADQVDPAVFTEDADIRIISATRRLDDGYASGYATSKWGGEVLLREAHEICKLPVAVFRPSMILPGTKYVGQLNLPDRITRLMLTVLATGTAPETFYEPAGDGSRQRAHFDGLPVDFTAEAIATLGEQTHDFATYHVVNVHDDGVGLDQFVDWLVDAGYPIDRVVDYGVWVESVEAALRTLPEKQRRASILPMIEFWRRPDIPHDGGTLSAQRFEAAVRDQKIGRDGEIPHITKEVIMAYPAGLKVLGLVNQGDVR
ncbi:carboxylic acid reductase [Mycobacterium sp. GA-2829]|uniref:carboxylic acid reductase n=1 Tax=Mycobacterium sp. GA-2829 TaxID=1772283 RepID=UPI00073FF523|nr:carboxylic acid reductase [Mycobacterium sp. GA-2829]KUI29291.1 oxidoreductase [Mycobacterium sp. GA-2829]